MTELSVVVSEVVRLFETYGSSTYDEGVTLTDHCLQTAALAKRAGASESLVATALLHDIGHLLQAEARGNENYLASDWDHDEVAANWLQPRFGDDVAEPVRHHVSAKRWLCFAEPGYFDQLSGASVASLAAQGGVFGGAQAEAWRRQPGATHAVELRRWDDAGKSSGLVVDPLDAYLPMLDQLAQTS